MFQVLLVLLFLLQHWNRPFLQGPLYLFSYFSFFLFFYFFFFLVGNVVRNWDLYPRCDCYFGWEWWQVLLGISLHFIYFTLVRSALLYRCPSSSLRPSACPWQHTYGNALLTQRVSNTQCWAIPAPVWQPPLPCWGFSTCSALPPQEHVLLTPPRLWHLTPGHSSPVVLLHIRPCLAPPHLVALVLN